MKSLGEVLQLSTQFLKEKNVDRPRRMAEELLSHIVHLPRIELYMNFDRPMADPELDLYRSYIVRKAKGEPWQYIVGEVEFYHCRFRVTPAVLIPRPETEILVSKIVETMPGTPLEVWDICCGSGCIGIALKKARPQWKVTLSDISEEALKIARENAIKNGVDVTFLQGDLLEPFRGKKSDILICNPPYVTEEEYAKLDLAFEPKLALIGGTTFYDRFSKEKLYGKVFFEIGAGMGPHLLHLFPKGKVEKDWAGHDRFFCLELE
jgi:release factor glutamine methyltransferase